MKAGSWKVFAVAGLLLGLGCALPDPRDFEPRPATVLKSGPVTTAEVTFEKALGVPGALQEEATQLLRGELGMAPPGEPPPEKQRLLRVRFQTLQRPVFPLPNLAGQWSSSVLAGALLGAYVGSQPTGNPAVGAAVGGALGFVVGPYVFSESKALQKRLGYLPWNWTAELEIIDVDGAGQTRRTRKAIRPKAEPFYEALPPEGAQDPKQVQRATVRGVLKAFARQVKAWQAAQPSQDPDAAP